MTEFKQIIGRGTRIDEDYGKLFFTIMDFKKATELFRDPDFDGEPVVIYEPVDAGGWYRAEIELRRNKKYFWRMMAVGDNAKGSWTRWSWFWFQRETTLRAPDITAENWRVYPNPARAHMVVAAPPASKPGR